MEMELRLHEQSMKYKVEKDEQLQKLACLSLLNQATMTNAMVTMAQGVKTNYHPLATSTYYSTWTALKQVTSIVLMGRNPQHAGGVATQCTHGVISSQ